MTPQPGQQTIAIYILFNISRTKSNETMKFGQLVDYDEKNIFLHAENDTVRLVPDLIFTFQYA